VPNPVVAQPSRTFVAASNLSDFFSLAASSALVPQSAKRQSESANNRPQAITLLAHKSPLLTCSRARFLEANNDRAKLECAK